ncbi:NUDIX hydrolase [Vermiculatibacterium agrestimuris]|uniref:NUDIX hydrolase n=1 Tax=Vermiculatibacterium agrestimuris TaxID=2941519 RepID=UPI00203C759E|nr:NUDIX hydrolase [Vermiculatibacterium agrestimuris]
MYIDDIEAYIPQDEAEAAEKEIILDYIRRDPDTILLRENRAAHMTASGFILSADGEWVLMAHHNIYRVWAWTGGHADGEGDLLKVALKEAEEETGASGLRPISRQIASLEILPVWGHVKRGEYVPSHLHLNVSYLLTADRDGPLCAREGENTAVDWLPAEGLLERTNEWQMDPIYTKLLARGRRLLG